MALECISVEMVGWLIDSESDAAVDSFGEEGLQKL